VGRCVPRVFIRHFRPESQSLARGGVHRQSAKRRGAYNLPLRSSKIVLLQIIAGIPSGAIRATRGKKKSYGGGSRGRRTNLKKNGSISPIRPYFLRELHDAGGNTEEFRSASALGALRKKKKKGRTSPMLASGGGKGALQQRYKKWPNHLQTVIERRSPLQNAG